ncbi:hypothetical protein ALO45_101709 [Pseudomonas syringae pv. syringae]|nr:hypothetical protein ALO45_101709 [Pseudomonas syringae pv. syringae]
MVKETMGYGHRTHPFEIHGDRGSCRFSNLHEQKPGQSAVRIVALCQNFRHTYSLPGIQGCVCMQRRSVTRSVTQGIPLEREER